MAVGDWVAGSYGTLNPSTLAFNDQGLPVLSASWQVMLPSGIRAGFLGPYSYTANPQNSIQQETVALAAALAADQGIPFQIGTAEQVNPDGTVVPLAQTPAQKATVA